MRVLDSRRRARNRSNNNNNNRASLEQVHPLWPELGSEQACASGADEGEPATREIQERALEFEAAKLDEEQRRYDAC